MSGAPGSWVPLVASWSGSETRLYGAGYGLELDCCELSSDLGVHIDCGDRAWIEGLCPELQGVGQCPRSRAVGWPFHTSVVAYVG